MADGAAQLPETMEQYLVQQLAKEQAESARLRRELMKAQMDVARLQTILAATRTELGALKEELHGSDEGPGDDARSDRYLSNDVARGY
jgi:hypothetical protein